MTQDASFEDGAEKPIQLVAVDATDLGVISGLVQDAVFLGSEMSWLPAQRRFAILCNRFRWEDVAQAKARNRPVERVRSILAFEDVTKVLSQGIDPQQKDTVLSVLTVHFEPTEDGAGRLVLTLAGDGAIGLDVECINVSLQDVTRPYIAPSKHIPHHPE
ncbi:DUF2948 family protein [Falsihalocynthiibacter arcticus]|uniref:DUF2948 domain-containing protein n=1 Tax=Falsihalocynthiibacter arcticus TaxID=1579316 RepID=A0A126UX05_9RHOB|nr:DUF2948 family protein [Falsihalocynthiibacter arcticus]AML50176.1 hypothetical protein RC74_01855 [Falsihalocynthiibacter arcticus]